MDYRTWIIEHTGWRLQDEAYSSQPGDPPQGGVGGYLLDTSVDPCISMHGARVESDVKVGVMVKLIGGKVNITKSITKANEM